jgi:tetratricopeptide (TPR) repeat protein
MGIVAGHRVTTDLPAAMEALEQAQAIAERLGSNEERSRIHCVRGNLYFAAGDGVACRREHEAALDLGKAAGNAECEAQALSGLGDAEYSRAQMLSAGEYFRRCIETCERAGLVRVAAANRLMIGHCLYYANRLPEAEVHIRQGLADARSMGLAQVEIFGCESLGYLNAASGHYAAAEDPLRRGIELARAASARRYLSLMLRELAQCRAGLGALEEARAMLDEGLALSRQTGMAFCGAMIFAGIASVEPDQDRSWSALKAGEAVLREGALSHSHLHFYRDAIDVSLKWFAWSEALRYAAALEEYVRPEPLPWATVMVERGRALAAHGAGAPRERLRPVLEQVRTELVRARIVSSLPAVDAVLRDT